MRAVRHTLAIARRELAAYFHSPVAFSVVGLFLVLQGISFSAVVAVLADPRRPAPYGAVLRTHFGGTFFHWSAVFLVVAVATMRLIAEERRQGTWESLCTAPVGDGSIVIGKWLGALGFYATLWAPTLAYVLILRAFAPPGAAPDPGPIATAYLGVLLSGAAFLAIGVLASAATANQVIAAALTFVLLIVMLMVGLAPEIAPAWFARHPTVSSVAGASDLRRHIDDFARGITDTRHVAYYLGVGVTALVAATMVAGAGRRPSGRAAPAALGVALVAAAVLLGNVIVARHPRRLDATSARVYTLDARTRQILADVQRPVRVLVLVGADRSAENVPLYEGLYEEVDELLRRFQAVQPLIAVEKLDPALDPGRIDELAEEYALTPVEVAGGGAVIFMAGPRHRAVGLLDMAAYGSNEAGGVLTEFRGEEAFAAALLEVTDDARPEVCFTDGHGELPLAETGSRRDLSAVADALERDAVRASPLSELTGGVPSRCAVVAVFGAQVPFTTREAQALDEYLARGGRLLVGADPDLTPAGEVQAIGLEALLVRHGARLAPALVIDRERELGVPLAWGTLWGYGGHPIAAAFNGRRATIWFGPRWVEPVDADGVTAAALVSSSADGWAETDVAALRERIPTGPDDKDAHGPVPIAVAAEAAATGARVVVFGSARSFTTQVIDRGVGVNDALAASAVAWLTGRTKLIGVGPKTPEQFRVVMTTGQVRRLFYATVVGLPAVAAGLLLLVWWRRRS